MPPKEPIDVYLTLAKNIKKYRHKIGMTQKELAYKTGYSYAYIRRVEGPKCPKNFSIATICHIANILNIDMKKLFEEEDI